MNENIFREYDIRGIVGDQLTDATVDLIARAAGTFFDRNSARRIAIGYDARSSSPHFAELFSSALTETGCDVLLIGMVPTPALYYTVFTQGVDGGVMITGSHNPADHNGFKICLGTSSIYGAQIQELKAIAKSAEFSSGSGKVETKDVLEDYRNDIISRIDLGSRRMKAVVDAGNGVGGITAVPIYRALGIDVVEMFTDPDPNFPNHHPDPTVLENLQDLIAAVREYGADLGIAFDGDGDRVGIVDEKGRVIWGDELMILFSRAVLAENPGSTIIAEVKCSKTLFNDIEQHGGTPIMWKAGHSLIKAKMKESSAVLAGEMSGHMFFADRYYGFDDAAYAGARVLEILSNAEQNLSELLADVPQTFSTPELRVPCSDEKKFDIVRKIAEHYSRDHEVTDIDGARITFDRGWGLVRASNTQAILVLRFEADSDEALNSIRSNVESRLSELGC